MLCLTASRYAINSASALESATVGCSFEIQEIAQLLLFDWSRKIYPVVDLLLSRSPPQSASVDPVSLIAAGLIAADCSVLELRFISVSN